MAGAFLSFGDAAPGESTQKGHERAIELIDWSWGADAESSWAHGGGAAVGRPSPREFHWTHNYDAASVSLLRALGSGRSIPRAELQVVRGGDGGSRPFLTAVMTDVLVTAIGVSGDAQARVVEAVSMVFKTIQIDYSAQDAKGGLATPLEISWDIPAGRVSPAGAPSGPAGPVAPPDPVILDPSGGGIVTPILRPDLRPGRIIPPSNPPTV